VKCGNVQASIEEYLDGTLGPVDEMCIDIHLIQCEECRAEIHGLRQLLQAISGEVHCCPHDADDSRFLERFHTLREAEIRRKPVRLAMPRFSVARAVAIGITAALLISTGVLGQGSRLFFGKPVMAAHTSEITVAEWAPYLRDTGDLIDLSAMGLVDSTQHTAD
jgi:predicted anti-sigma-YlaC factor YlaD